MRVIVDRIENGYAVCELENGSFQTFPMSELPAGCLEGECTYLGRFSMEIRFISLK